MNIHPRRFIRPALAPSASPPRDASGVQRRCLLRRRCLLQQQQHADGRAVRHGREGRALASAQVTVSCVAGSATTLTDGGGNYRVTVNAALPCVITVTSGGTSLHSLAYAGGTFNTTPETELMLVYLAAQFGTNTATLIGNFQGIRAISRR